MGKLTFGATGFAYSITEHRFDQSDINKCFRCNEKVFLTEQQKAAGKVWHKKCLTCGKCNKTLQTNNALSHQGNIYCNPCHKQVSSATIASRDTASTGQTVERVDSFRSRSNSLSQIPVEARPSRIYSSRPLKTMNFTASIGVNELCPACGKRVYFAEEQKAHKKNWHKSCFKCRSCKKTLTPGRSNEHDNSLFCQNCYSKLYGPKGYSSGGNSNLATEDRYIVEARHSNSNLSANDETFVIKRKHHSDSILRRHSSFENNASSPNVEIEQDLQINQRLSNEPIGEENYPNQQFRQENITECEEPIPNGPISFNYYQNENNNKEIIYAHQDNYSNSGIKHDNSPNYPIKEENYSNVSMKEVNYSNKPIGEDNYSNQPIREDNYSNLMRKERSFNDPMRMSSMSQENNPKMRRQSSTAAIRDENIVYSIDQKIKPKLIIAKKKKVPTATLR